MDQPAGGRQNSSRSSMEPAASGDVVGVCDDCCIDGSLMSTDCNPASGCALQRSGADPGEHCAAEIEDISDDVCTNFTDADTADTDPAQLSLDCVQPHPDSFTSVHGQSSNDCADVSADEKVSREDEEKQIDEGNPQDAVTGPDVDEPVISAIDIYSGLQLADSWNPVTAQRRREFGVGRVAPSQFTCKASGSLGLVRRLQLYSKLDGHTGCVNALHFNDSGKSVNLLSPHTCRFRGHFAAKPG